MKRRDLLTAAAGAMTGCAVSRSSTGAHDFDDLYGRLDRGLASVGNPFQEIAPEARFSASERAFVEAALRSLLLTSAVHELPEEERGDPRMISRLEAHRNDFELAMRSTRSMLEMSPAHRITLQRAIRTKPSLASKAADVLGRHAKLADVGAAERFELRRIAQQTAWRIQHQPLSMVADDTLDRMRRVEMRIAADSTQLRQQLALRGNDEVFDARSKPQVSTATTTEGVRNPDDVRGKHFVTAGLVSGGVGLNIFGAGWLIGLATFSFAPALIVCVVGGVGFVVGIILTIYGGVVRANSPDYIPHDGAKEDEEYEYEYDYEEDEPKKKDEEPEWM